MNFSVNSIFNSVAFGVDCFAQTGFTQASQAFLSFNAPLNFSKFEMNAKVASLCGSAALLSLIGIFVQYRLNRDKGKG